MTPNSNLQLAQTALQHYNLKTKEIIRLGGMDNLNFKISTHTDHHFLLRIHSESTSNICTKQNLQSELFWLQALQNDTSLIVPQPVANQQGKFISQINTPHQSYPPIFCSLMTWVAGKIPPTIEALTTFQLEQVGNIQAQLHQHTRQVHLPPTFQRETLDASYFAAHLDTLCTALKNSKLKTEKIHLLRSRMLEILTFLKTLQKTPSNFGLIHADFHSGNYLIYQNEMRIIDFGRCAFGFYLFDLALALMELTDEDSINSYLRGYQNLHSLTEYDLQLLPLFTCLAYIDNLGFLAENKSELPFIIEETPRLFASIKQVNI